MQLKKCEKDGTGREVIYLKLERMGYDVGHRFVERCVDVGASTFFYVCLNNTQRRCTLERTPRLIDSLDIIKFLCKEFWTTIFKRKVDKLQTNHRVRTPYLRFLAILQNDVWLPPRGCMCCRTTNSGG